MKLEIPKGLYCYATIEVNGRYGIKKNICMYYNIIKGHMSGYCNLLKRNIEDSIKICRFNID